MIGFVFEIIIFIIFFSIFISIYTKIIIKKKVVPVLEGAKCYKHDEITSVGICRVCKRPLCETCFQYDREPVKVNEKTIKIGICSEVCLDREKSALLKIKYGRIAIFSSFGFFILS